MSKLDPIDLVKKQSRDGAEWAKYFIDMHGDKLNGIDEDDMRGWFCNAMMSVHDSLYNNEIKTLETKYKRLKTLYKEAYYMLLFASDVVPLIRGNTKKFFDDCCYTVLANFKYTKIIQEKLENEDKES